MFFVLSMIFFNCTRATTHLGHHPISPLPPRLPTRRLHTSPSEAMMKEEEAARETVGETQEEMRKRHKSEVRVSRSKGMTGRGKGGRKRGRGSTWPSMLESFKRVSI